MTVQDVRKSADGIRRGVAQFSRAEEPIWHGILDLIERSEYGEKSAGAGIVSLGLDDLAMEAARANAEHIFRGLGRVSAQRTGDNLTLSFTKD
jgi:hypothetical protein